MDKLKDDNINLYNSIVKSGGWVNKYRTQKAPKNPKPGDFMVNKSPRNNKSYQYAWKKVLPSLEENQTGKSVCDKSYHWCPYHMAWCVHTAAECNIKEIIGKEDKKKSYLSTGGDHESCHYLSNLLQYSQT